MIIKLRFVASLIVVLVALSSCQTPATPAITPAVSVVPVPTATPPGLYHLGWIWPQAEPSSIVDQVTSPDGTIYAIDEAGNLTALRPSGQVLWEYPNKTSLTSGFKAPLLSPDGQQVYLTSPQSIVAINNKGTKLWDFHSANEWIDSGPYLAPDGSLYVQSYFINSTSSRKRGYRIQPGGQVSSFSWPESFNVRYVGFDSQARIHLNEPGEAIVTLDSIGKVLKTCLQRSYFTTFAALS